MRLSVLLSSLALVIPASAFAQLSVHYELNEEGPATAQELTLRHTRPTTLKAAPGENLTAVDLPAKPQILVEKRYWYGAQVNWNEKGRSIGYRRAGTWTPVRQDHQHRVLLGYETGTPPAFDTAYWKKARTAFLAHSTTDKWTEAAQKCTGPTDAGSWGSADGAYCSVVADAVELRFTDVEKGRKRQYQMTYVLSRGR
jgi:hypothetical protein